MLAERGVRLTRCKLPRRRPSGRRMLREVAYHLGIQGQERDQHIVIGMPCRQRAPYRLLVALNAGRHRARGNAQQPIRHLAKGRILGQVVQRARGPDVQGLPLPANVAQSELTQVENSFHAGGRAGQQSGPPGHWVHGHIPALQMRQGLGQRPGLNNGLQV